MIIIRPHHEFIDCPSSDDILRRIELAGRTCYKSEDRIAPGSAEDFVRGIIRRGHLSVIEHVNITVRIVCDRAISHELVRHRLAAYSQESSRYCVAGETLLNTTNPRNKLTVAELFANKVSSRNGAWKRMRIRQLNERTGELEYAKVEDVFCIGEKPTITVTTKLGYKLTLTRDHKVYTRDGYVRAGDLSLNSDVAVNGTERLYQNEAWLRHQYTTLNKTAVQIANEFNFNVSTVKKWVRKHLLPKKPSSYWNKGRTPWNKDAHETDYRVAAQANALREHHWNRGRITVAKADRVIKLSKWTCHKLVGVACELCASTETLQVHHIDKNRENNTPINLKTLCASCHQRVHSKNIEVVRYDRVVSIEDGGVVPVYDISMASQFHNFVADGVVVHNCNYAGGGFGRQITVALPLWYDGIIQTGIHTTAELAILEQQLYDDPRPEAKRAALWLAAVTQAEASYLWMVKNGAAPQEARSVLPNSLKTEVVMTANLREWKHIFKVRCAPAAHPQMREIMRPMLADFYHRAPAVFEAEYREFVGIHSSMGKEA